ncbi:threonine/serine exporter family protein [uncultured Moraxella sp.]|uniref:threonine/serine exporter family protein n=1 Tax=uncultured Moraxella sp. TaxID=263769 RepID=UPI0025CCC0EC|nr:threonine/serine exporter family protein [uncultured Moraxella sp.]
MDVVIGIAEKIVLSCIITIGWCLMFTLPKPYIRHAMLVTAVGVGIKYSMLNAEIHLAVSTFFGAMVGSFLGVYFAQQCKLPPKALIVPSLICMMPGITAYKAMVSMVQIGYFGFSMDLFVLMMSYFFDAIFVISALVLGLSIPGILFYRRKPIV